MSTAELACCGKYVEELLGEPPIDVRLSTRHGCSRMQ